MKKTSFSGSGAVAPSALPVSSTNPVVPVLPIQEKVTGEAKLPNARNGAMEASVSALDRTFSSSSKLSAPSGNGKRAKERQRQISPPFSKTPSDEKGKASVRRQTSTNKAPSAKVGDLVDEKVATKEKEKGEDKMLSVTVPAPTAA